MIGEIQYEILEPAVAYKLPDGTVIYCLSPDHPDGVTNEILVSILLNRLRVQGRNRPTKATSRAITKCEELEETLWRFTVEKQQHREELAHVV